MTHTIRMRYRVVSVEQNFEYPWSHHHTLPRAEQALRRYQRGNPNTPFGLGFRVDEYRDHDWHPV